MMGATSNEKQNSSAQKPVRSSNSKKKREGKSKMSLSEKKKIWSYDLLVEAMKPSEEELEYRREKSNECDDLQQYFKLFQCTKCHKSFKTILRKNEKVPVHPCLGVLMCQKCCDYYEDGEFSLDSEGEDKYCRWCGEGGTIFGCFKCICGFCANCIKRHFKFEYFKKVQKDDNWLCFFCNSKPLWHLRYICSLAVEISNGQRTCNFSSASKKKKISESIMEHSVKNLSNQTSDSELRIANFKKSSKKRIYSSSSDESPNETVGTLKRKFSLTQNPSEEPSKKEQNNSFDIVQTNILKELEKVLKLSKYQMSFGASWSANLLENLFGPDEISKDKLLNICQKTKWFLSTWSTYLVQFSNTVDSLEKNLISEKEVKISHELLDKEKPSYLTILKFLGFVNHQIKTFMEEGFSLSDILEAEIYNDDSVIGIKKKITSGKRTSNVKESSKIAKKKLFKGDKLEDSDSKEDTEEQKEKDDDRNGDENNLEIIGDESSDIFTESNDESKSLNRPKSTETNYFKNADAKEDIQKILAILENA